MASTKPASCERAHPLDDARQEPELIAGGTRSVMAPVSSSRTTSMMVPSRSRIASERGPGDYFTDSHFVFVSLEPGWLTSRCQTTAAKPSVCGVIRSAETVGMTTHASADLLGVAAVAPDDAEDLRADLARELEERTRFTQTFFSRLPPPTEKTSSASPLREARDLEPLAEAGVPALVVHARGQLAHVVGRRVGLEAADLPEVVDRVAGVTGRAADAEDEEPRVLPLANGGEPRRRRPRSRWTSSLWMSAMLSSRKVLVKESMRDPSIVQALLGALRASFRSDGTLRRSRPLEVGADARAVEVEAEAQRAEPARTKAS